MHPETKTELVHLLEESRQKVDDATAGFTEDEASERAEGRWSARDCVEHLAAVEARFQGRLETAARVETPIEARVEELTQMAHDRSTPRSAPDAVIPEGKYATLAEALAAFHAVRERSIQVAKNRAAELPLIETDHPFFGKLSGESILALVAGHSWRHAEQIAEIRAGGK